PMCCLIQHRCDHTASPKFVCQAFGQSGEFMVVQRDEQVRLKLVNEFQQRISVCWAGESGDRTVVIGRSGCGSVRIVIQDNDVALDTGFIECLPEPLHEVDAASCRTNDDAHDYVPVCAAKATYSASWLLCGFS